LLLLGFVPATSGAVATSDCKLLTPENNTLTSGTQLTLFDTPSSNSGSAQQIQLLVAFALQLFKVFYANASGYLHSSYLFDIIAVFFVLDFL
jgi:hypothetical protein